MHVQLSQIAIASNALDSVRECLEKIGLVVREEHKVPTEGVNVMMLPLEGSMDLNIELLQPTGSDSPIAKYLEKNPKGGVHHLGFQVDDIEECLRRLENNGFQVLPPGIRKAARGRALFVHPKSFGGILVEFEEISEDTDDGEED